MTRFYSVTGVVLAWLLAAPASAVTLEQVISREHPTFGCEGATLAVGRDGMVYLGSAYVLRLGPDGSGKVGGATHYATHNVAANAAGTLAAAAGHFQRSVLLYDKSFTQFALCNDFLVSDQVGWDAPGRVEVGASGDFYGLDQHRQRILRLNPVTGKIVASYPLPKETEKERDVSDFRVCEKTQNFITWSDSARHRCVGFDGKTRFRPTLPNLGGWDLDDDGNLYWIEQNRDTVSKIGPDGNELGAIKLQMGEGAPTGEHPIIGLRIRGSEVFIRRRHAFELFQRYDLTSGQLKNVVTIDYERLSATFAGETWTAGQEVPFAIEFFAGGRTITPSWRVWANPLGTTEYRELPWKDGKLAVPADGAGVYQIKVTPEAQPVQTGTASEYLLRTVVEIRQPGAKGTATVMTPGNRVCWGQGEAIPATVALRAAANDLPAEITVRLQDGARTLAEQKFKIEATTKEVKLEIWPAITAGLKPGQYTLAVDAPGLTGVPQLLTLGPGLRPQPFQFVHYGDYGATYPQVGLADGYWIGPDAAAAQQKLMTALGLNLVVDRIGSHLQISDLQGDHRIRGVGEEIAKRLEADPTATAPGKARLDSVLLQTMAGYAANGISQMAEPLYMDAGLPLGTGFDPRKPEDMCKNITTATETLKPFTSFRGWVLSMNWWNYGGLKADAVDAAEAEAYQAAVKMAKETGAWAPVLDKVSDRRYRYAVEAQKLFTDTARAVMPNLVTANSCPYRKVESYPPVSLSNVDEVDLHVQWEQVQPPYVPPHNVDFYKRPGKRAWGHPELWNDAGTGDQALPNLFNMIMRGADGVGFSGAPHPWGIKAEDSRLSDHGFFSVWRALGTVTKAYGPWFTTLQDNDAVVIVASGRQFRIDEWQHITGRHFARLWEAYATCLYNHTPASILFTDDMTPDSLKKYRAVLLVDQWVQLEPVLAQALQNAKAAGTAIFYDNTCRKELVADFTPLGIAFDKFENDPSQAGDDAAYWRFQGYVRANLPAVRQALAQAAPPPAGVEIDEVFLTERKNGDGKVLFLVNNTLPALDPGQLWRVTLALTSKMPLVVPVKLPADAKVVYDVFALQRVTPENGVVPADLRSMPARVYATLPAAIDGVELRGPKALQAGQPFTWQVRVLDAAGAPIPAGIPVRVRLRAADHSLLDETCTTAGAAGVSGSWRASRNAPAGMQTLEATELFSGKTASLALAVTPQAAPVNLQDQVVSIPAAPDAQAVGKKAPAESEALENAFGPHLRDLVVSADGATVLMNANNWDHNLYAVDGASGRTKWRGRVGHYFAFAPQALKTGFAAQGFDFNSAEGYHLYLVGNNGKPERRFALYGLPKRLIQRFVPAILKDRINNFAVSPDGRWVASAGDLGLAVWARDGKLLWKQDWWKTQRHTATLAAPDAKTLLVVEGMTATAYAAATGERRWQQTLAAAGEVRAVKASQDGRTLALPATTEGGRVYLLRDGQPLATLITDAGAIDLSADGSLVVLTKDNLLKFYSVANGLQWTFACDTTARCPRLAPDGKRVTVTSDLGSLYVLDSDGRLQIERDLGAVATVAWAPNGDLFTGTWQGKVSRLDLKYGTRWSAVLQPAATDVSGQLLADDGAPTTRIAEWSNAEAQPQPITPNLLADRPVLIRFVPSGNWGGEIQLQQDAALFHDGKTDPPAKPWLGWNNVNQFAETSPFNYLLLDFFNTRVKATSITLVEDAAHPESWLRDATLEYWNVADERWLPVMPLLSDAAVHTHTFPQPVEAARFRLVMPWGLVGNLRLGEIVLHGEALGSSHPDVIAKKPRAVLFDENEDDMKHLCYPGSPAKFLLTGPFSGGRCIQIDADQQVAPIYRPPFGHVLPNWKFDIVEKPEPGQYRWLQFAWKALDVKTTGITLRIGNAAFCAGQPTTIMSVVPQKVADAPPAAWTTVRVDLWALAKGNRIIDMMCLAAAGGPAAFDQVVLGRTEADLPEMTK